MIDRRLAACGTTYLDAFYIHGIGPSEYGQDSVNWPKSDAYKKTAEALKSSGKVKMVGFSCHDGRLTDYLNAAAEGGFLDIIMLAFNPFYPKGGPLDKALDAAHKAGIGLVAMKTMRSTKDVPKRLPELDKLGLTTHQAVLHSAWSDPRISVVCNMIDNVDQMTEQRRRRAQLQGAAQVRAHGTAPGNHPRRPPHDVYRLPRMRSRQQANRALPSTTSRGSSPITNRTATSRRANIIRRWRRSIATRPKWISPRCATPAISRPIIRKSSAAPNATSPDLGEFSNFEFMAEREKIRHGRTGRRICPHPGSAGRTLRQRRHRASAGGHRNRHRHQGQAF